MPAHNGKKQSVNIKMPRGRNNSVRGPHSSHTLPTLSVAMEWNSAVEVRQQSRVLSSGHKTAARREKGNERVGGHGEQEGLSHNTLHNIGRSPGQKSTFQAKIENSKYPQQKLTCLENSKFHS